MKILVTGGAGYIGSHTCLELLKGGFEVVVVDNLANSKEESLNRVQDLAGNTVTFHKVDLLDKESLDAVFAGSSVDAVIHFAGLKAVGESVAIPLSYYHNNVTGTLILCEVISRFAVLRFIQPDCATPDDAPVQTGQDKVINPMPRISYFNDLLNDIKAQAGFGLIMGLIFGSVTFTAEKVMLVAPTYLSGIAITASITAMIVSLFFIPPLHRQLWGLRLRGEVPIAEVRNRWVAWLPSNPWLFGAVLLVPLAVEMSVVFWAALSFMRFEVLNYFQFLLIIVLHNTLLFKALVPLIILRAMQPSDSRDRSAVLA